MSVRVAVIPAAGLGTRFLPITRGVPKEMLPILSTPALQLVIDEAAGAGIERIVIVTSHAKPAIESYFGSGDQPVEIQFAYQDRPAGLGHAIACAAELVDDQPFAVMLPDELMGDASLLAQMCSLGEARNAAVVAVKSVPQDQLFAYGVIDPIGDVDGDGVVAVRGMVEKPAPGTEPSDMILIGRYVLPPEVFGLLENLAPSANGEVQLTDALMQLAATGSFYAVVSAVGRHDTGTPFGWLTAVVDRALADPVMGDDMRAWLKTRA